MLKQNLSPKDIAGSDHEAESLVTLIGAMAPKVLT